MFADVMRGHLVGLILAVVEPAPQHGYAIIQALQARSGGALDVPTGTLYPALRRLERAGYLRGSWQTVGGRRRRTYRLTASGRRVLAAERTGWHDFAAAVDALLGGRTEPRKA